MKIFASKLSAGLFLMLCILLTGCLKDKGYDNYSIQSIHPDGTQKIIELKINAGTGNPFLTRAFNSSNNDTVIHLIPVNLASADPAAEDILVTLVAKPELIDDYNAENGTDYAVPDESMFTILNAGNVVKIAKGTNTGFLELKFKPTDFIGGDWAFAYAIQSVDKKGYTISGNLNQAIAAVGVKNKYDGIYIVTGTLVDYLAPQNSSTPGDPYPFTAEMVTVGSNSIAMKLPGESFYHLIHGNLVYGNFSPVFNFDPATDEIVSVTNYYGNPSPAQSRSGAIDPSGVNALDADGNIVVKYFLYQAGTLKASFNEKLTYSGPR